MSQRHSLTDEQWNRIKDLVPGKPGDRDQSGKNNRLFVDAVVFVLKTGVPWRDLPERYGNWNSVWRCFDRWCANGVWERIAKELCDAAYDGDETREVIKSLKAKASIKPSKNRKSAKRYDKQRYKNRNQVERFFNRIKQCRRIATRYEKTIKNFAGFVWIAVLITDVI